MSLDELMEQVRALLQTHANPAGPCGEATGQPLLADFVIVGMWIDDEDEGFTVSITPSGQRDHTSIGLLTQATNGLLNR